MRLYIHLQDQKILQLLLKGKTPKAIAHSLRISPWVVYDAVRRNGFSNITKFLQSKKFS